MNYRDLQNISHLTQHILTESASEVHDPMNRWPYSSPYLQEDRSGYGDDSKFKQDTDADSFIPGVDVPKPKKYGRISRYSPMGGQRSRTASNVTRTVGEDPGAPRSQKIRRETRLVKKDGKWVKIKEDFKFWLDSLLGEGYDLSDYTIDEMFDIYLEL